MSGERRRFVLIGNGVAGTTCAEVLRKEDPAASITLITDEPYPLYNRVALPRMLQGRIPGEKVFLKTADWHTQHNIRFLRETRVIAVDTEGRTVLTSAGQEIPWDALLVATGGRPNGLPVPGGNAPNCMNFQYYDDTVRLIDQIQRTKRAVSVGGSFISYEMAEAFRERKLEVTWLIRGPRWLRRVLDEEGGELVDRIARAHGVDVVHGEEVAEVVVRDGVAVGVRTTGDQTIDCQLIGSGVGLTMNTDFLRGSGIVLGSGVITDEFLRTNIAGVFAAGDIAEYRDRVADTHHMMGTWDNALAHGRVVALNMLGGHEPYVDVPTYQSGLFDTIISVLGVTPEALPGASSVTRCDFEARSYRRLFFQDDRLVGAVLLGSIKGKKRLMDLIREHAHCPTEGDKRILLQS